MNHVPRNKSTIKSIHFLKVQSSVSDKAFESLHTADCDYSPGWGPERLITHHVPWAVCIQTVHAGNVEYLLEWKYWCNTDSIYFC